MKFTKFIKVLCILALTVVSSLAIVACTIVDNTLKFTYENGEELTETVQVELGDLYLVPEVTARQGATEYEVTTVVTDSTGAEVKLTNGKFRPTDTAGYKMTFSAVANEQTTVFEVSLVVVDTVAPTFTIFGTSGSVALIDSTVQVPECTVNDASSTELVASYTVKSPSGEIINAIDGEFTVNAVGDYTITYTATDASGNVGKQDFIYSCKKAKLLNAFDSVETSFSDMSFGRFEKSMWSVDTEYAVDGNAVRFDIGEPSDGVSNWCYLFIKCLKEDGTPYTFNEFKRFAGIQISVYSSGINELDLVMETGYMLKSGANTVYYSMESILAMMQYGNDQYTELNGFIVNLKSAVPGEFLVFDNIIGIYADDYVEPPVYTYADGTELPESFVAECPGEFTLPEVIATRGEENVTFTATVKDSLGNTVELTDGKFTVVDTVGYTVEFSANDGSEVLVVPVGIIDYTTPYISLSDVGKELIVGSTVTVPSATVEMRGEELTASYTVSGPDGEVAVTDGTFVMPTVGEYTITYTATSTVWNKTATKTAVYTAYEGDGSVRLNDFVYMYELVWTGIDGNKQGVSFVDGGMKIVRQNSNSWMSIVVMLTEQGVILTYDELVKFSKIEVTLMTDYDTQIGLFNTDFMPLTANQKTTLTFTRNQITASQETYGQQYDANGFWFNLKDGQEGQSITFYSIIGYGRTEFFDANGETLADTIEVEYNKEFTMPAISVVCDGKTVEYECVVKDSAGEVVELLDGKFLADDLEGYTFNYTAITDFGTSNFTVNVNVVDMRVPQIKLKGYKSYTDIGEYVLPEATASMEEEVITPTVKVTDANGEELTVVDGKVNFNEKGVYTVTYKAVSTVNEKSSEVSFNVTVVKGDVLNNADKLSDIQWNAYASEKELVSQNGIAGLKFAPTVDASWARTCIPLYLNGTFLSLDDLGEYQAIQIRLYTSVKCRVGLVNAVDWIEVGWNTLTYSKAQIASAISASADQYSANENGWYLNTNDILVGDYFVLESIIGIYADDYVPTMVFSSTVNTASAQVGSTFTVEQLTAHRKKSNTPATVTYVVFDSEGKEVTVTENQFTVTDVNGYEIVYTAIDELGEATFTVKVNTKMTAVLNSFATAGAYKEDGVYHFPAATGYEKVDEGVKVTLSDATWTYVTLMLKRNGTALTFEKLLQVEKIELVMYSSVGIGNFGLAEILGKSLVAGKNVITFTAEELKSAKYDVNGLWLQFNATTAGETLTFVSITAYYPEGYDPDARESVTLNSFTQAGAYQQDGIYYSQIHEEIVKTDDGVMVKEKNCSWAYFTILLTKDGVALTAEELKSFTSIELVVISSCDVSRFGIADVCDKALTAGVNTVVFTAAELATAKYDENGLWLQLGAGVEGETLTFVSIKGYND